jgi:hypothetical protein
MRVDDKRLREQRNHLLAEVRAINARYEGDAGPVTPEDQRRFEQLETQVRTINGELERLNDDELDELRNQTGTAGWERPGGNQNVAPLFQAYRQAGWTVDDPATVSFDTYLHTSSEYRGASFTGAAATMNPHGTVIAPLGADRRFAYRALPTVNVGEDVTSVNVLRQASRNLPAASTVVRAIDAVTAKPLVDSGLELANVAMNQVAAISTNTPRIVATQDAAAAAIEADLRLAVDSGLDLLTTNAAAGSPFTAPGTDNILVSIRKAMSAIWTAGYQPTTVVLTPAQSEAIDTMVTGISGGTADFVFGAGRFAPGTLYGLDVRVAAVPAAWVFDANAWARLYASAPRLQSFEVDAGTTNRLNVRLELNAAVVVERVQALRRIAAS